MGKKREESGFPQKEGGHVWARGRLSCCDSTRGPSGYLELPQQVALQEGAGGDVSWHPFVNGVPPKGKRRLCPLPHGEVHKRARIPLPPPPGRNVPLCPAGPSLWGPLGGGAGFLRWVVGSRGTTPFHHPEFRVEGVLVSLLGHLPGGRNLMDTSTRGLWPPELRENTFPFFQPPQFVARC